MNRFLLYISLPFLLSGCVGTMISGKTGHLGDDYPDIRSVPGRPEATKPRGTHEGDEKTCRSAEFTKLEQDREQIKARNQALREGAFPNADPTPAPQVE